MKNTNEAVKGTETVKLLPVVKKEEATTEEQKTNIKAMIEKFKPNAPTAEERIQRISHFEALSKRFHILKEKHNGLKMFDAGNDRTNAKVTFKNAQGFEFEIRNSNVIEKLKNEASFELNILLSEAENEILTFEI